MKPQLNFPLVLFDGYCNLCNVAVNFIIKHDRKRQFRFVAIQSEAGKLLAAKNNLPEVDSVILLNGGRLFAESDAALRIACMLGFPWNLAVILKIIPKGIRDWGYRKIAQNRYRWFGKRQTCRVLSPGDADLFLQKVDL